MWLRCVGVSRWNSLVEGVGGVLFLCRESFLACKPNFFVQSRPDYLLALFCILTGAVAKCDAVVEGAVGHGHVWLVAVYPVVDAPDVFLPEFLFLFGGDFVPCTVLLSGIAAAAVAPSQTVSMVLGGEYEAGVFGGGGPVFSEVYAVYGWDFRQFLRFDRRAGFKVVCLGHGPLRGASGVG